MKRISIILMMLMLLTIPMTFAQETEVIEAGLTPDNRFYFLDRWQEQVSLAFTFNNQNKAQKHLNIANERIAEIKEVEDIDSIEGLQSNIRKNLDSAQNNSVTDLSTQITLLKNRNQQALNEIKDKLPTETQQRIQNTIQNTYRNRNVVQSGFTNEEQNFLQEFEGESLQLMFNNSKIRYFKIDDGRLVELNLIEQPSYTIEVSDEAKFNNLVKKYNDDKGISYEEVTEIATIPLSLKARVLRVGLLQ